MIQQFSRLTLSSQDYLFSQIGDSEIPAQLHHLPQIQKLESLMIVNFKSFDRKFIGPFLGFTSIIGPNGSGKSNILDAIMFCFCSESARHLLIDTRQLINRQGKQSFKELSKMNKVCSVQATFLLKNDQKLIVCRTLDAQGREQYLINFKNVSKKIYQNIMIRQGINCNWPNYAIWQGQVDKLIFRGPNQMTNLLQNLSGSIYFKKPYQQVRDKLKTIQSTIEQKSRKINKFKTDRKHARALKQTNQEYNKFQSQYQEIAKKIYMLHILDKEKSIQSLEEEIDNARKQQKKRIEQINGLKLAAQKDMTKKLELQQEMNNITDQLISTHSRIKNASNPTNILKIQTLKQTNLKSQQKLKQIEYLQQKKYKIKQSMPQIPPSSLIQQYLSLYQQWESQNTELHFLVNKKKNDLLFIEGMIQMKLQLVKEIQNKKLKHEQKKKEKMKMLQDQKRNLQMIKQSIKSMQVQSQRINQKSSAYKSELQKMSKNYQQMCSTIEVYENLAQQCSQNSAQSQLIKNLCSIEGFYGILSQKIKPNSSKYEVCFSIIFQKLSNYLLCQSEQSSKRIGNRLKQLRKMKNVIILNNVKERRSNDVRKNLGKDAVLAVDIIDFDENIPGLKQFISQQLHGKIVCDNLAIAYRIKQKNIEGVKEIYTLDGSAVKKHGQISSHGNPESIKRSFKFNNNLTKIHQQMQKLNKQKLKLQLDIKNMRMKFDQKQIQKRKTQIQKLHKKKQFLIDKIKQMQAIDDKSYAVSQQPIKQLKQLEKQKEMLNQSLVELQRKIKSSKIFDKFMKKHNIANLQGFRNANNFHHVENQMRTKIQSSRQISLIQASIQKLEKELKKLRQERNQLQNQISKIPDVKDLSELQKDVLEKQKIILDIRGKLSKISNISKTQLSTQTNLPALEAKLIYSRQKIGKQIEDIAQQLGVQFIYPISQQQIIKQLNLPRKITDKTLQSLLQKYEQQKSKIETHLEKHNSINLLISAGEDQQKIQQGMNVLLDEIDQAIKQRKKCNEDLEIIRKDRSSVLTAFINTLRDYLSQSYKILTEQEDGSFGTVTLYIQNEHQPFQHGVYYTPTPPTKRFVYDLQQLSGGERSIASLALQYSLSLTSKSPLLVLDETDAFLDSGNVNKFLRLINSSLQNKKTQMIVVTHKQGLFSASQSLVGVSRPKSLNLSQVYSLKLINQ